MSEATKTVKSGSESAPHMRTADVSHFLPQQPQEGHRGFYPVKNDDWYKLPAPLRGVSVHKDVVAIWTTVSHPAAPGLRLSVRLSPMTWAQLMFTSGVGLGADLQVECSGDRKSFAKWWQDTRTGAYCIKMGPYGDGMAALIQGGFENHVPAHMYFDTDGDSRHPTRAVQRGVWQMSTHLNHIGDYRGH